MPGEDLTHGPPAIKKAGGSRHRFGRINRHSLRDGLRLISRSPRGPGFLAPVAGVMRSIIANLTSASGGRDHATSPSAQGHVRLTCHPRPSHPRPTCRDDSAYVPLHRGGMICFYCCFYQAVKNNFGKSEIGQQAQSRTCSLVRCGIKADLPIQPPIVCFWETSGRAHYAGRWPLLTHTGSRASFDASCVPFRL